MYTLIESAKMSRLDPETYLRDVLARIADQPIASATSSLELEAGPLTITTRSAPSSRPCRFLDCKSMGKLLTLDDDVVGAIG
jgi:hypothetical protein